MLAFLAGLMQGIILTIKALVGQISYIYKFNIEDAAHFGVLFILGGIIGSFAIGIIL